MVQEPEHFPHGDAERNQACSAWRGEGFGGTSHQPYNIYEEVIKNTDRLFSDAWWESERRKVEHERFQLDIRRSDTETGCAGGWCGLHSGENCLQRSVRS